MSALLGISIIAVHTVFSDGERNILLKKQRLKNKKIRLHLRSCNCICTFAH
jgi:hypothetical protein